MIKGVDVFIDHVSNVISSQFPEMFGLFDIDRDLYMTALSEGRTLRSVYGDKIKGEFGVGVADVSLVADVIAIVTASWQVFRVLQAKLSSKISVEDELRNRMEEQGLRTILIEKAVAAIAAELSKVPKQTS